MLIAAHLPRATLRLARVDDASAPAGAPTTHPPVLSVPAGSTFRPNAHAEHQAYTRWTAAQRAARDQHPSVSTDWCPPHGIPRPTEDGAA
jgi:hypothetical protein